MELRPNDFTSPSDPGFDAELMDGVSAEGRPVIATLVPGALQLASEGIPEPARWPLERVELDPLVVGAVHLRHRDHPGLLLSSSAPGFREALEAHGLSRALPRGNRRWLLGIAYLAGTAAMVGLFVVALPTISSGLARQVPLSVEAELGVPSVRMIGRSRCDNTEAQAALDKLAGKLRMEGDPEFDDAQVQVVNLAMMNAFTFPGGSIAVTRGLLDAAETPEELAGVLAHELEHVSERHVMTQVVRSVILTTGWQLTVGDFSGLMAVDPATVMEIAALGFSRDAERDADSGALRRLEHAEISSRGFATFFGRLEKASGGVEVPEWLSSHPASAVRQQAAMKAANEMPHAAPLTHEEWQALKNACSSPAQDLKLRDLIGI
jgi:beta-barrel assembly-enhancing protease